MREDQARRVRTEIARITHEGTDWVTMTDRLGEALNRVIDFDFHCWHPIDPATLLFTGGHARRVEGSDIDATGSEILASVEFETPDVNQWSFLARSAWPLGSIDRATHGNPQLSRRYRELLDPRGIQREIRASFVSDGNCWGAFGLYRHKRYDDFSEKEERFLGSVCGLIADGFRRALLVTAELPTDVPEGPGIIMLDTRNEVESATPTALRWMRELLDGSEDDSSIPSAVRAVAVRARAAGNDPDLLRSARARTYTRSGRWLVLHGMLMGGRDEGRTAVVIEPGRPAEVAPLIVQAYGLSEREREVTQLVLSGNSTNEIAKKLYISPHTVQDHLKMVFEKTGVRSRRELVARIFFDHYWPGNVEDKPLAANGFFADAAAAPTLA